MSVFVSRFRLPAPSGTPDAASGVSFERIVTGIEENVLRAKALNSTSLAWRAGAGGCGRECHAIFPCWEPIPSVILNGEVLEKPRNADHAARMLRKMSGHTHQVMTAVALADSQHVLLDCLVVD